MLCPQVIKLVVARIISLIKLQNGCTFIPTALGICYMVWLEILINGVKSKAVTWGDFPGLPKCA